MTVRVLVVGSSGENADLAREALIPLECEVSPVTSISLGLFLAHKALPDLIVAGNEMVDGNGLDLLREVRADLELRSIPFVFMCAQPDMSIEREGLALGADKVIARPASADEFLAHVKPYLYERRVWRPEESPE